MNRPSFPQVLLLLSLLLVAFSAHRSLATPPAGLDHVWSQRLGNADWQEGSSVATDAAGNVYLAGKSRGTVDFGGGPIVFESEGVFVLSLDRFGHHRWSVPIRGTYTAPPRIAVDGRGSVYVTSSAAVEDAGKTMLEEQVATTDFHAEILLVKLDRNGSEAWRRRFDGQRYANAPMDIATDDNGDVIVTGWLDQMTDFGGGRLVGNVDGHLFLAKFDARGRHLWSQAFGPRIFYGKANSLSVVPGGDIYLTGDFTVDVNFGGATLTTLSTFDRDVFLARFDRSGHHLWSADFGDAQVQYGEGVAASNSGNAYITGSFFGAVDFGAGPLVTQGIQEDVFLAAFDPLGTPLWSRRFGTPGIQIGQRIAVDPAGGLVLYGDYYYDIDLGGGPLGTFGFALRDIFLARFASDGEHRSSIKIGTWFDDYGGDIAVDPTGAVVTTERFLYDVDLGGGNLTALGSWDVCVAKFGHDTGRKSPDVPATERHPGASLSLLASPNPFRAMTTIEYSLSDAGPAVLDIYDAAGRHIVRVANTDAGPGAHRIVWDGRDNLGQAVSSGVYYARLSSARESVSRKIVLVR